MNQHTLVILYYTSLGLISSGTVLSWAGKRKSAAILALITIMIFAISIWGMYTLSGHLPVSGEFEKQQCIAFFLLLIMYVHQVVFSVKIPGFNFATLFVWFLLIGALFSDMKVSEAYLIYSRPEVVLFFQLRMVSMAMFAYALAMYGSAYLTKAGNDTSMTSQIAYQGRNFSILGAAFFLAGELSGSVWALNGWGDPWRWSRSFFIAGGLFLMSMLASHIPAKYKKSTLPAFLFSAVPLLLILLLYLL